MCVCVCVRACVRACVCACSTCLAFRCFLFDFFSCYRMFLSLRADLLVLSLITYILFVLRLLEKNIYFDNVRHKLINNTDRKRRNVTRKEHTQARAYTHINTNTRTHAHTDTHELIHAMRGREKERERERIRKKKKRKAKPKERERKATWAATCRLLEVGCCYARRFSRLKIYIPFNYAAHSNI